MLNKNIIILAAGQGTRMNSSIPKVLHNIANKPILQHVIEAAQKTNPNKLIIIYGFNGEIVKNDINARFPNNKFIWVYQEHQLGTGHAVKCALSYLDQDAHTLILCGDTPLITGNTLSNLFNLSKNNNELVILTSIVDDPSGYGRIIHNDVGDICGVVEEKDATQTQRNIKQINAGIYVMPNARLHDWLDKLSNKNQQNEYYLTDLIKFAYQDGLELKSLVIENFHETLGVNNKQQLEFLERIYQLNMAKQLLQSGVTLIDKNRIEIRGNFSHGKDCIIDINCVFTGEIKLASNVKIGAGCILNNVVIGDNVELKPYSVIENAHIGANAKIGPFARIRPNTNLMENVHVGNFVEIKNSQIGTNSKINHLTYIGDAVIGSNVNIGAGSVTCNYDGKNKSTTKIEDNVFVGSGTMMVAPVTIRNGGIIGAGSVITKDTEKDELTVARSKQVTIKGWKKKRGW